MNHRLTSEQVIIEIANNYPEISEYTFCIYEPGWNSDTSDYNPPKHTFWIPAKYLRSDSLFLSTLKQISIRKEEGYEYETLGIASRIRNRDGRELHLTLIDFCSEVSCEDGGRKVNLEDVKTTLAELGLKKGYILNSGNSYHYVGEDILFWEEYQKLLERMKKQESIGEGWPYYQLKKGFGVLRIFACPEGGKPSEPELVERFENTQLSLPFL